MALAAMLGAWAAQAGEARLPSAVIPFESERAAARGDKRLLKLNDDAARIPAHRIHALPVVDGRMGDRALLDGGVLLYFPDGRIVLATAEFHKADSHYRHVAGFDRSLGPVCATDGAAQLRINRDKAISLVRAVPGAADAPSYRVVTALDIRHLAAEPNARALYNACLKKQGVVSLQ